MHSISMKKQKVCIMGAGVGGLTAAFELSKPDKYGQCKYDVVVLERNQDVGGQARSFSYISGGALKSHNEYGWHAIHTGYYYFLSFLREIKDSAGKNLTTYLKPIDKFVYSSEHHQHTEYVNAFMSKLRYFISGMYALYSDVSLIVTNALPLIALVFTIQFACDERVETWDYIRWAQFLAFYRLSPEIIRWLLDSTGIYLGMDYANLSAHTICNLIRSPSDEYLDKVHRFYCTTGPISEVIFSNIEANLIAQGVRLYKSIKVENIVVVDNKIQTIECNRDISEVFDSDTIYINGLSVESFAKLINRPSILKLAELGYQIQPQVLYRFDSPSTEQRGTVVIHYDVPWFMITRIENTFWEPHYHMDKAYWAVGIGIWDVPGFNGKTAHECTELELAEECWAQIKKDKTLDIPEFKDCEWFIWDSFYYKNGKIQTYEPKWSNSVGTLELRPPIKDPIDNLYNATAYSKNKTTIFNMEGATESGKLAASLIKGTEMVSRKTGQFLLFRLLDKVIFTIQSYFA